MTDCIADYLAEDVAHAAALAAAGRVAWECADPDHCACRGSAWITTAVQGYEHRDDRRLTQPCDNARRVQ